uniref:Syndecan n=1 Tax=Chelonoidis abingdonii TaxID=106734 RepID=A0A8C0GKY0_CHEAB
MCPACLWLQLYILFYLLLWSFLLKQTTNLNLPPEDLDSSGDDEDAFSGSGAGEWTCITAPLVINSLRSRLLVYSLAKMYPGCCFPRASCTVSFPQGDFIFSEEGTIPSESELADSSRDAEAAGTSQGLMDRKEVLGGVIAGGLVGLLFAVFLVGFMLYRMKKKDEGSYSLDEPKQSNGGYQKPQKQEEFYA